MQIIQVIQKSWKTKIKDPPESIKKLSLSFFCKAIDKTSIRVICKCPITKQLRNQ